MTGASRCFTCLELIMEKMLAQQALIKPKNIPKVYWVSNLKMSTMPQMMSKPAMISSFEIRLLLNNGSKIAVNKVIDERHTNVTETVEDLMAWKNKIQCPPTSAPVKKSRKKASRFTLIAVRLNLK